MARADEIGDVGDDPLVAGLDEEVVVERLDALVDGAERVLDGAQERAKLVGGPLLGVADAVDLRQPVEQRDARWGGAHGCVAPSGGADVSVR